MPRNLVHPREELLQIMQRIYGYRMTTTSGGNLSVREPDGDIWITPSRVDKGSLRREDMVCVRCDGAIDGLHPPSSEFPFHKAIYGVRADIRGIVHAHSVALVAFSICGRVPNTRLFHRADQVCGETGFAPYALPGSRALAESITAAFNQGFFGVILENHGVVVGGADLQNAFQRFETLEFTAKTIIKASTLGPVRYLTAEQLAPSRRPAPPWPQGEMPPPGQPGKGTPPAVVRFPAPRLSQPPADQHRGQFFGPGRCRFVLITPHGLDRHTADLTTWY